MSLDIDWTLLQPLVSPSSTLLETLNAHLQSTARPSFIGPISITSLDFGTVSPEVELKDIRDVWRAFDEGDDQGDDEDALQAQAQELERRKRNYRTSRVSSPLDDEDYDMVVSPMVGHFAAGAGAGVGVGAAPGLRAGGYHANHHHHADYAEEEEDGLGDMEETQSVYSGWSPRQSVAAVGIGAGNIALGGIGSAGSPSTRGGGGGGGGNHRPHHPSLSASHSGSPAQMHAYSQGHEHAHGHERHQSYYTAQGYLYPESALPSPSAGSAYANHHHLHQQRYPSPSAATRHRHSPSPTPPITSSSPPPPSPPARPGHLPSSGNAAAEENGHGIPSLQLHLHVSHFSDLNITLLTSLQVNYPSPLFMSLPLKLSITGLSISADMVLAYNGAKHRLHLTIVPSDDMGDVAHDKAWAGAADIPIGQRLLPNLTIESEIGHADAHVLRNVGKVERFIADAVRKTLVDELVFPNFQTVAL